MPWQTRYAFLAYMLKVFLKTHTLYEITSSLDDNFSDIGASLRKILATSLRQFSDSLKRKLATLLR